jgi:adenosylcobinamide-phosphate synthase
MLSYFHYPITPLLAVAGVALDAVLGEPRRWHALVGFGNLAHWVEKRLNTEPFAKLKGAFGVALLLVPVTLLAFYLCKISPVFNVLLLYFAIGHKSLHQHARAVLQALQKGAHWSSLTTPTVRYSLSWQRNA